MIDKTWTSEQREQIYEMREQLKEMEKMLRKIIKDSTPTLEEGDVILA